MTGYYRAANLFQGLPNYDVPCMGMFECPPRAVLLSPSFIQDCTTAKHCTGSPSPSVSPPAIPSRHIPSSTRTPVYISGGPARSPLNKETHFPLCSTYSTTVVRSLLYAKQTHSLSRSHRFRPPTLHAVAVASAGGRGAIRLFSPCVQPTPLTHGKTRSQHV